MITPQQAVEGVASFCTDHLPELTRSYDFVPDFKTASLPDVVVEVTDSYLTYDDPDFPFWQIEQRAILVYHLSASIMVDNSDPQAASELLRSMQERLTVQALESATLGGRVPIRSPRFSFSYSPPLAQYEDGTVGREMTFNVSVADLADLAEE